MHTTTSSAHPQHNTVQSQSASSTCLRSLHHTHSSSSCCRHCTDPTAPPTLAPYSKKNNTSQRTAALRCTALAARAAVQCTAKKALQITARQSTALHYKHGSLGATAQSHPPLPHSSPATAPTPHPCCSQPAEHYCPSSNTPHSQTDSFRSPPKHRHYS
jgi:hypothetical protein